MRMRRFLFLFLVSSGSNFSWAQEGVELNKEIEKEVRSLARTSVVKKAFEYIEVMDARTTKDLVYLTEIPAPPFKEQARAEAFLEMLQEAGVDEAYIDEAGNAVGIRKGSGTGRVVVLDAHLDTVFPEETDVTVQFRGDTLAAPGIGDDTRGLVMVATVLRALNSEEIRTEADVWFVGTVGEEGLGDLKGVKHFFRDDAPIIDAWIAIDGGRVGRVMYEGVGSYRYRAAFKGPGGHSWGAFGLGNPHHALGLAIDNFVLAADDYTKEGLKTSYNVGRIGGGTSINSIPFESWMEVDMRSISPERLDGLDEIFKDAMRQALDEANALRRDGPALELDLEMIGNRPSGSLPTTTPLIQRAIAATRYFEIEPATGPSSTNSNIPISLGVPSVTIGWGGHTGGTHSLHEWWLNDESGIRAIKLALLLLVSEAGVSK